MGIFALFSGPNHVVTLKLSFASTYYMQLYESETQSKNKFSDCIISSIPKNYETGSDLKQVLKPIFLHQKNI